MSGFKAKDTQNPRNNKSACLEGKKWTAELKNLENHVSEGRNEEDSIYREQPHLHE